MNALSILGIPAEFGILLLTLSLVLFLTPYFSGIDFGVIRVPELGISAKRKLEVIGPFLIGFAIFLFLPIWSLSPPLAIRNVRISQSIKFYRIEIDVSNINDRVDGLITNVEIYASDNESWCSSTPLRFEVSDHLVAWLETERKTGLSTRVTEGSSSQFSYEVNGYYERGICGENALLLNFDSSINVPKQAMIKFHILLPKDLKILRKKKSNNIEKMREKSQGILPHASKPANVNSIMDLTKENILERYPFVTISIRRMGSKDPIRFYK
jgi:hypothetical protein